MAEQSATSRLPSLGRAASLMGAGTVLSRVTGLVRTATLAAALGVSSLADAFNTASAVPTMLLVLVSGGTLSAVLVPGLARRGLRARAEYASQAGALIVAFAGAASLLLFLGAPALARLFALNLRGDPTYADYVEVATLWLRLFAPQVLLLGISVFAVAVLTAAGRLGLAGVAPAATNLLAIAGAVAYIAVAGTSRDLSNVSWLAVVLLGVASTAGVAVMALAQYAGARRTLPALRIVNRPRWRGEAARELSVLGRWSVVYVVANQIGLALVLVLANGLNGGAAAYLWGFTVMQLPYGVIAVSVLSALQPRLSQATADKSAYGALVSRTLDGLLAMLLPIAVGLYVLADPIVRLLFGYGAAATSGTELVATCLRGFAIALIPFTLFQLLTRAHYALLDTRRPALVNAVLNVVNVVLALLVFVVVEGTEGRLTGLVGAYSASYVVGSGWLFVTLASAHRARASLSRKAAFAMLACVPVALTFRAGRPLLVADLSDLLWRTPLVGVVGAVVYVAGLLVAVQLTGRRRGNGQALKDYYLK